MTTAPLMMMMIIIIIIIIIKFHEALPGVAYPGVWDNCSTLNTKTGYDDDVASCKHFTTNKHCNTIHHWRDNKIHIYTHSHAHIQCHGRFLKSGQYHSAILMQRGNEK